MRVENIGFNIQKNSMVAKGVAVANAEEIKAILFLGIKSDLHPSEQKRKVDIII